MENRNWEKIRENPADEENSVNINLNSVREELTSNFPDENSSSLDERNIKKKTLNFRRKGEKEEGPNKADFILQSKKLIGHSFADYFLLLQYKYEYSTEINSYLISKLAGKK